MIIGVISDSHRETKVAASAIEWLLARGADLLVHAEGIVAIETLRLLRQSSKPYFEALDDEKAPIAFKTAPYNNDQALVKFKNDCNLRGGPFCTEFARLRLKIMHHTFYLFDEEPAAQNEAGGLNLDADLGTGADRAANLNSNFNTADVNKILNGARRANENFKNAHSASSNLKSRQSSASPNVNLGLNAGADVNSNANLDLNLDADLASSPNANLNSNASANLATNTSPDMNSKASSSTDRAVNLTASLSANLSTPNSCVNLAALSLGSNLTANSELNASGKSKNRGLCGYGTDKISTIKIYGHTHFFAAAIDKNGALVLNPGEIYARKKWLFGLPVLCGARAKIAHISSPFAAQRTIKRPKGSLKMIRKALGSQRKC